MLKKFMDFLFKYEKDKLTIYPDDMRTILNYQTRMNRCSYPYIESHAGPVTRLAFQKIYNGRPEKFFYETPSR